MTSAWGNGFRNQWVGDYLPELTTPQLKTMLALCGRKSTSPFTDVKLATLGGAVARVGENDTAFGFPRSNAGIRHPDAMERPEEESRQHLAWTQEFLRRDERHTGAGKVYVNFVADEGERRVADAYNARTP